MRISKMTCGLRHGVAASALLISMLGASSAVAQDAAAPEAAEEEAVIVVTGSRIARPEIESATPVTAITSQLLTDAGQTSAGDIIQYVPALFSSATSDQSATRGSLFGGTALDLRGLGDERTLVLVNGRRHVASDTGTAIVDVETIPTALIERTEILTGGASSIYGSDAVSGVVNYVLKRNFTGLEMEALAGISEKGDAGRYYGALTYGIDINGGRGNIVFAGQYSQTDPISYGDRSYLRGGQRLDDDANPALRFQEADLTPALIAAGASAGQTIIRNGAPRYAITPASLVTRAQTAAPRAFLPGRNFSISSPYGIIGFDADGDLVDDGLTTDFDRNGVNDCDQTYNGRVTGYGCYVVDPGTGRVRPFKDGLIAGFANQFGGDGIPVFLDKENIVPSVKQYNLNLNGRYEVSSFFKPFFEAKFVRTNAADVNNVNSFNDTIPIKLDNPFIPAELLTAVNGYLAANPSVDPAVAQLFISRDNTDFGLNRRSVKRDTFRIVAGAEGDITSDLKYETSFNYGRTKETEVTENRRLEDRFYAAVDAVRAPNGQIVCRSSLNPNVIPGTSPFPAYDADPDGDGIYEPTTFRTNDGTCRPLNLFGLGSPSAEAVAFVNPQSVDKATLTQFVAQAFISGSTESFFRLPGGGIGFAVGGEYRKEKSVFTPDVFDQQKLFYESGTQAESGSFNVKEVFGEIELPIFKDTKFAEVLTVNASARYSDYSLDRVGGVFTWGVNGIYSPIRDIRFRGSFSRAIRAPNITNLFSPTTPATFRPIDPCDAAQINRGPRPAVRAANCRADGIPVGFTDPLTARITGATGGNPTLEEERSDSYSFGVAVQPRFIKGLTITADYWNYKIVNAIDNVAGNDIVTACYDSPDYPNNGFCGLFTRNRVAGPTFLGFNFLKSGPVNFARFNTDGIDLVASYNTRLGSFGNLEARFGGTYLRGSSRFTNISDPDSNDPSIGEAQEPEYAFNAGIALERNGFRVGWESFWQSKQYYQGVEVEDSAGFATPNRDPAKWSHNLNFRYELNDKLTFRAGIRNITDTKPFKAEAAYPVSAVGRNFFFGVTAKY
jgi:iron complex outermembrane recepter protein